MKNFYSRLKEVYGPTSADSSPFLSADGTKLISQKNKILEKWVEHFDVVLNSPSSINDKAIEWLPQVPVNESLDVIPTLEEVQISVNYPVVEHPDLTQFLQKFIRMVDQCWWVNFWPSFNWYGWKNNYRRTSKMPPSSIFTNGKGTAESPCFQFWARS